MVKLTKALIKKYGVSKKAWAVARQQQGGKRKCKSKTKIKQVKTKMVKRRKSYSRRAKSYLNNPRVKGVLSIVGMVGYGYIREEISDKIAVSNIGKNLPATQFTDEAVMLGVNKLARMMGGNKVPVLGGMLRAGKSVEWARVGQTIKDMRVIGTGTAATGGNIF